MILEFWAIMYLKLPFSIAMFISDFRKTKSILDFFLKKNFFYFDMFSTSLSAYFSSLTPRVFALEYSVHGGDAQMTLKNPVGRER